MRDDYEEIPAAGRKDESVLLFIDFLTGVTWMLESRLLDKISRGYPQLDSLIDDSIFNPSGLLDTTTLCSVL